MFIICLSFTHTVHSRTVGCSFLFVLPCIYAVLRWFRLRTASRMIQQDNFSGALRERVPYVNPARAHPIRDAKSFLTNERPSLSVCLFVCHSVDLRQMSFILSRTPTFPCSLTSKSDVIRQKWHQPFHFFVSTVTGRAIKTGYVRLDFPKDVFIS